MLQENARLVVNARRPGPRGGRLEFVVPHTRAPNTAAALRRAGELALELSGRITILAALPVPYPLPLSEPSVAVDFFERTLWSLALAVEADTTIQIYLCRDARQTLRDALPRGSTVLLGDGRWWLAPERRLARALLRDGHAVFLIAPASL